jgi:hypothetical protein
MAIGALLRTVPYALLGNGLGSGSILALLIAGASIAVSALTAAVLVRRLRRPAGRLRLSGRAVGDIAGRWWLAVCWSSGRTCSATRSIARASPPSRALPGADRGGARALGRRARCIDVEPYAAIERPAGGELRLVNRRPRCRAVA